MNDFDRLMLRLWRWLPLACLVAALFGYALGTFVYRGGE